MKANTKLILIGLVIIILATLTIRTGTNNPFYKTNETLQTTVVNKYYATGKMGGSYSMILKSKDGRTYTFPAGNYENCKKGDKITLYLYKREKSGAVKYKLY